MFSLQVLALSVVVELGVEAARRGASSRCASSRGASSRGASSRQSSEFLNERCSRVSGWCAPHLHVSSELRVFEPGATHLHVSS